MRLLIICLISCAAPSQSGTSAPATPITIAVLGTSDLHGRMHTLPLLASAVSAARAKLPVVLLDGGDAMQGTLESDLEEGTTVIDAYNLIGYTAMAVGNHEFDYGPEGKDGELLRYNKKGDPRGALKARAKQAKFPLLSSNLFEHGKPLQWENVKQSVVVNVAGVNIGIIGVSTEGTTKTTLAANLDGITMGETVTLVTAEAAKLRAQGATIVLVTAHAGGVCTDLHNHDKLDTCEQDSEIFDLARKVPPGSIDGIVAGHTHQGVAQFVAGIPIIQSFSWGKKLGRFDLDYDPVQKKVVAARIHDPFDVKEGAVYEGVTLKPNEQMAALVAPAIAAATAKRNEKLGPTLEAKLKRAYDEESALGNFITSQMLRLDTSADFAVQNGGGLRADFPEGALTYGALYETLPFDNRVARVRLTGAQARSMFERNLRSKSGVLSLAGGYIEAKCNGSQLQVQLFLDKKGGRPPKDDEVLLMVTNDFVATGGDGVIGGGKLEGIDQANNLRDAVAEVLRANPNVLKTQKWFDKSSLRIRAPSQRPVECPSSASARASRSGRE